LNLEDPLPSAIPSTHIYKPYYKTYQYLCYLIITIFPTLHHIIYVVTNWPPTDH